MLQVNQLESAYLERAVKSIPPAGPKKTDSFAVSMTDGLLKSTRQYDRWNAIRKNHPGKAAEIAQLVLERHTYVAGKAPATAEHRRRFDRLTARLWAEGVYLYKSHQFKNPIFADVKEGLPESGTAVKPAVGKRRANASPATASLKERYAGKDCFEFLAGVLEDKGIAYYGAEGLGKSLIAKAQREGKNPYAYLTGEGVTQTLSRKPLTVHVPEVTESSGEEVWNKVEPHLREGAIVSFSSRDFGHTGVVGRARGRWVYVNSSGSIKDKSSYRVLEEDLRSEIGNRLRRAAREGRFLEITVGAVDSDLAARFGRKTVAAQWEPNAELNLLT